MAHIEGWHCLVERDTTSSERQRWWIYLDTEGNQERISGKQFLQPLSEALCPYMCPRKGLMDLDDHGEG